MAKATKDLTGEHKAILKAIDALLRECEFLSGGGGLDKEFFTQAIDFIRNYADRFHHAKEEDILFKELDTPREQMHCDPRGQMLHEHGLGRKYVKGMEDGVAAGDKAAVVENARGYGELLRQHIHKEDNILYPMAEEALGTEKCAAMTERFRQVDEKFSESTKRYLSWVEGLAARRTADSRQD